MHELSLAQGLLEQLKSICSEHGATKITKVSLSIGKQSGIVIDSFEFGFEILSKDEAITENAVLEILTVDPTSRCMDCKATFAGFEYTSCKHCNSTNLRSYGGDDLVLTQVEME